MNDTDKRELESKALELYQSGVKQEEIEKQLDHVFMFFIDQFTGKLHHITLFK